MPDNYCVYVHTNKINGKKYIGQTCQTLKQRSGKDGKGYAKNPIFGRAIEKYGWDNFTHEVLIENISAEHADSLERLLIKAWKTQDIKYGYNIEPGGEVHKEISEHTRKLFSERSKNFWNEPGRKEEFSKKNTGCGNPFYGKHHTPRSIELIKSHQPSFAGECNPNYGNKWSEEQKKSLSDKQKDRLKSMSIEQRDRMIQHNKELNESKKIKVYQLSKDGNIIKEWECIGDAARMLGLNAPNIIACLKGRQKTCGGYVWRYVNG